MKKTKLVMDYDFGFVLIGITTSLKAFKLAWEINRVLNIQLVRKDDIIVGYKGGVERAFTNFTYQTNVRIIRLLRNKTQEAEGGKYFLAPECPHFDYLLVVHDAEQSFVENILQSIREIPSVELAAFIPLESLKTKENFIF